MINSVCHLLYKVDPFITIHVCTSATSQRSNQIKSSVSLTHVCLSHWRNTSPGETKLLASEIYEILQAAGNEEAERAEGEAASCKRKAHFFLGSSNKRAKTVVLHIDGLDDPVSVGPAHVSFSPFSHAARPLIHSSAFSYLVGGPLLSLSLCCQNGLKVSVWHRTGGWRVRLEMSAIEQQDVEIEPERCAAGSWRLARLHYSGQTASGGLERHDHRNTQCCGSRKLFSHKPGFFCISELILVFPICTFKR